MKKSKVNTLFNYYNADKAEAGCDEAGRGCLAGPVCAAAVILPSNFDYDYINDSKLVTEKNRMLARESIMQNSIAYAIAFVNNEQIDEINILNASILAMHKALSKLKTKPEHIIVDGNKFKPYLDIPHTCIVKGDSKYKSIAAASILAKTQRDIFMKAAHKKFPVYNWNKNKGYPTKEHRNAIKQYGVTKFHRKSYKLFDTQIEINFPE